MKDPAVSFFCEKLVGIKEQKKVKKEIRIRGCTVARGYEEHIRGEEERRPSLKSSIPVSAEKVA